MHKKAMISLLVTALVFKGAFWLAESQTLSGYFRNALLMIMATAVFVLAWIFIYAIIFGHFPKEG